MTAEHSSGHVDRVEAAMRNLRTDAVIAEVTGALVARGVHSLLLKGPTLRDWYPAGLARVYQDGDLLVKPSDLDTARAVLLELGFEPALEDRGLPSWWDQHAISWERSSDHAMLDLHRRIDGVGVPADEAWDVLWALGVPFKTAGVATQRLSEPGRILHVALHSAQHGLTDPKATAHVAAAIAAADSESWTAAAQLAERLQATDGFIAALRAVPAGAVLADGLGLGMGGSIRVSLLALGAPPTSLGIMQLVEADGWRGRMRLIASKVWPHPTLLKVWWPPAGRSWLLLAVGYLYRPLWLIQRAPSGLRAWRSATRENVSVSEDEAA